MGEGEGHRFGERASGFHHALRTDGDRPPDRGAPADAALFRLRLVIEFAGHAWRRKQAVRSEAGRPRVAVIIPALNEEHAIRSVLRDIPRNFVDEAIVYNGSTDGTARVAESLGAAVRWEPMKGYGAACLAGIKALWTDIEIVVFLDGDYSDHPEELETWPTTSGRYGKGRHLRARRRWSFRIPRNRNLRNRRNECDGKTFRSQTQVPPLHAGAFVPAYRLAAGRRAA